jgi:DNA polymerase-3 subunit epsilon
VQSSRLTRKLVLTVLALFLVPSLLTGAVLFFLYRRGVLNDPAALALAVAIGFAVMMTYIAVMAHGIGRVFVRHIQEIQLGTELMAGVNPDYRLAVGTGDELQALAEEINRMADGVRQARAGLEAEVERATHALHVERSTLAAVLETLGEGVVVVAPEGRVTLANRAAQERLAAGGAGLLGRSLFDFVDREKIDHFLGRLRASGGTPERFSLHPAGGGVLETVMTPFFDAERRLVGVVLVLRDVTSPARSDEERRARLAETFRELRGPLASVRSLAESLLDDAEAVTGAARPLLAAIHSESVRLSALVGGQAPALAGDSAPAHFERLSVADLTAMTLRRLAAEGVAADALETADVAGLPAVRAEASALSAGVARLARAALAHRGPGGHAWLRWSQRGGVLQLDVGVEGTAGLAALDPVLDTPVPASGASVREVVRGHAGESWAYAGDGRLGFRASFPMATPAATEAPVQPPFVGAGMASGVSARETPGIGRPDFYDFSLFDEMERSLQPAERERPLEGLEYVALDTETTGLAPLSGDRIVSLAAVKVRGGVVRRGETFDALVNPRRPIPAASVRFHGITDQMVAGEPPVDVVLPAFLRFAEGAVLVGHQVWFDVLFLARDAERLGLGALTSRYGVLDTLALSEVVHGPLPGHALEETAQRLGVVVRGRHSALGDALTTAEVFVRLLPLLAKRGIVTLGQAVDATRRVRRPWTAESGREVGP